VGEKAAGIASWVGSLIPEGEDALESIASRIEGPRNVKGKGRYASPSIFAQKVLSWLREGPNFMTTNASHERVQLKPLITEAVCGHTHWSVIDSVVDCDQILYVHRNVGQWSTDGWKIMVFNDDGTLSEIKQLKL
jgi:hypothetical protein